MTWLLATLALALVAALPLTAALVWARCHAVEDWHDHELDALARGRRTRQ